VTCTYGGSKSELKGTVKDGERMVKFLKKKGFEVTWMTDNKDARARKNSNVCNNMADSAMYPTANHVKSYINSMMSKINDPKNKAKAIWLMFAGHGCTSKNTKNESLALAAPQGSSNPGDNTYIDDTFFRTDFANQIPGDCEGVAVFDCCHSGSAIDLPFVSKNNKMVSRGKNDGDDTKHGKKKSDDQGRLIYFSGCTDGQVSWEEGGFGNLTTAFLNHVENGTTSLSAMIKAIKKEVVDKASNNDDANGVPQEPQFSTNDPNLDPSKVTFQQMIDGNSKTR